MATFTTILPELLEPFVTRIFFKQFQQLELLYPQLFSVVPSKRAFEDTFAVSPLGTFALKPEGTPISYDDPVQGARKRVVMQTFALGFRVTMEMMDDDQHNIISQMPADLGDSGRDHQENLAWAVLNTGFTNVPAGLDSLGLWNTAHVHLKAGGPSSNSLSPGVAMSVAGVEAAVTNFELTQDESGRQIRVSPTMIVIHPNERFNTVRVLESTQEPSTANNAVNPVNRLGLNVLRVPYLTDTDAWSMWGSKSQHSLTWYDRMEMNFSRNKDAQTKDSLFDGMYRAQVTFDDWRGTVGSQP